MATQEHTTKAFDNDLQEIARLLAEMGGLAEKQIAELTTHGLVETTPDGRLRVTADGFPLLDAIVADLAA